MRLPWAVPESRPITPPAAHHPGDPMPSANPPCKIKTRLPTHKHSSARKGLFQRAAKPRRSVIPESATSETEFISWRKHAAMITSESTIDNNLYGSCGIPRPVTDFRVSSRKTGQRHSICNDCQRVHARTSCSKEAKEVGPSCRQGQSRRQQVQP